MEPTPLPQPDEIKRWLDAGARRTLLRPVAPLLTEPIDLPNDPASELAPLMWLLEHVQEGIPVDDQAMPAASFAREFDRRFGWTAYDRANGYKMSAQCWYFWNLAYVMRGLTIKGRRATSTPRTATFLNDPLDLWMETTFRLAIDDGPLATTAELFLATMFQAGSIRGDRLENRFNAALLQAAGLTGRRVSDPEIFGFLSRAWNCVEIFVAITKSFGWYNDVTGFMPIPSERGSAGAVRMLQLAARASYRIRRIYTYEDPYMPDGPPLRPHEAVESPSSWWEPLEEVLPFERCHDFVYIAGGDGIHHYKHCDTRNYLRLDEQGRAYRLRGGRFVEIPLEDAVQHVFDFDAMADWAEDYEREQDRNL